jgi:hypothetical protein
MIDAKYASCCDSAGIFANPARAMRRIMHDLKPPGATTLRYLEFEQNNARNFPVNCRPCHNESKISPNSRRGGPSFGLIQAAD